MRYRKLRIAWSVAWGVVAVLLIVLWVRSYSRAEGLTYITSKLSRFGCNSEKGAMFFVYTSTMFQGTAGLTYYRRLPNQEIHGLPWWQSWSDPSESGIMFSLPYWLLSPATIILAALSWLRWSRRFSLRTLLIATTVVAVVLGLIVWLR